MDAKLAKDLTKQINNELFASYLYLSMSAWFEGQNWPGFAHWMRLQAKEELDHAMKIFDYLNDRGVAVILDGIAAPKTTWDSPLEAFKDALDHEKQVTKNFLDLTDLAVSLKDHASQIFLQWFITEQVEEEKSTGDVVAMLEKIRGSVGAVFQLDRQLGKREDD